MPFPFWFKNTIFLKFSKMHSNAPNFGGVAFLFQAKLKESTIPLFYINSISIRMFLNIFENF